MAVVQPSVLVLRAVCTTFAALAVLSTVARLYHRYRQRRLWIDDAWAVVSLVCQLALIIGLWIRTDVKGVGPLVEPREARVFAYWLCALTFTCTLWAARMSMLYSIIRITPNVVRFTRLTRWLIWFFLAMWAALLLQKTIICAEDRSWYKLAKPQCPLGQRVAILELCTDFIADTILLVLPVRLIASVSTPFSQKRLLLAVFSASMLTTLTSFVHAAYLIMVEGLVEALTANVEASVGLIVANIAVLVTWLYGRLAPDHEKPNMHYPTWSFSTDPPESRSEGSSGTPRPASKGRNRGAEPPVDLTTIFFESNLQQSYVSQSFAPDDLSTMSVRGEMKRFSSEEAPTLELKKDHTRLAGPSRSTETSRSVSRA